MFRLFDRPEPGSSIPRPGELFFVLLWLAHTLGFGQRCSRVTPGSARRGMARLLPSPKSADCIIATNARLPEITPSPHPPKSVWPEAPTAPSVHANRLRQIAWSAARHPSHLRNAAEPILHLRPHSLEQRPS